MRVLLWLLLLASIAFPLLFVLGCRNRDGLIDAGPLFIDSALLPDNFRGAMMRSLLRFAFCLVFHAPFVPWILLSALVTLVGNVCNRISRVCDAVGRRDIQAQHWIISTCYLPIARKICSDNDYGRD